MVVQNPAILTLQLRSLLSCLVYYNLVSHISYLKVPNLSPEFLLLYTFHHPLNHGIVDSYSACTTMSIKLKHLFSITGKACDPPNKSSLCEI